LDSTDDHGFLLQFSWFYAIEPILDKQMKLSVAFHQRMPCKRIRQDESSINYNQRKQLAMTYLSPKLPNPFISSKNAILTAPRFADLSSPTEEVTVVGGGTNSCEYIAIGMKCIGLKAGEKTTG
jgi:hypothetical protein